MLWVVWDMFVPLLIAFLIGLFVGWLFWRWRRSPVSAEALMVINENSKELKKDSDNLPPDRNANTSGRAQTAWRS